MNNKELTIDVLSKIIFEKRRFLLSRRKEDDWFRTQRQIWEERGPWHYTEADKK